MGTTKIPEMFRGESPYKGLPSDQILANIMMFGGNPADLAAYARTRQQEIARHPVLNPGSNPIIFGTPLPSNRDLANDPSAMQLRAESLKMGQLATDPEAQLAFCTEQISLTQAQLARASAREKGGLTTQLNNLTKLRDSILQQKGRSGNRGK